MNIYTNPKTHPVKLLWGYITLHTRHFYRMTRVIRTYGESSKNNPGNGRTRYTIESIPPVLMTQRIWPRVEHDVIKWKHFPCYWPFVRGIHRWPVNSPNKGQWCGALMFSMIYAWINGWVNNREAGDLRCHRAHYDVAVMKFRGIKTRCTDHFTTEYFGVSTRIVHRFENIALSLNAVTEQRFS